MARMEISLPHALPGTEAVQRVKTLLAHLRDKHDDKISDLTEVWEGHVGTFNFKAKGFQVSGTLTVEPHAVILKGNLPWAANLFRSRIEEMIRSEGTRLLD